MPKLYFDTDEVFPFYVLKNNPKPEDVYLCDSIDVTEEELNFIKTAYENLDKAEQIIKSRIER